MTKQIIVYGASGYTGLQIAEELARRGIPFVAAGRSKTRLEEQLNGSSALEGADYEIAEVVHQEEARTALFTGRKIVLNMVGPFMQLGVPTVKAALAAGVHYIDTTGEQDWMLKLRDEFGADFAAKGLILAPATSLMWNSGLIAAEYVLDKPGIDTLDISYIGQGVPSKASTYSFLRMCCQPQMMLKDNELSPWEPATGVRVGVPGLHETITALPWSGGGEAVWYADDHRVRNCTTVCSFRNEALMTLILSHMVEFAEKYANKSEAEQEAATNRWAEAILPPDDLPREDLRVHRHITSCHGRGTTDGRSVIIFGATGYATTAIMTTGLIEMILAERNTKTGFRAAAHIMGPKVLHQQLIDAGLSGPAKIVLD